MNLKCVLCTMAGLVIAVMLMGCSPKFKVGDCIVNQGYLDKQSTKLKEWEREEELFVVYKVLELGTDNYRVRERWYNKRISEGTTSYFYDNIYVKIDCPKELKE